MFSRHIVLWSRHVGKRLSRCCGQDLTMTRCSSSHTKNLISTPDLVPVKENKVGEYDQQSLWKHRTIHTDSSKLANDSHEKTSEDLPMSSAEKSDLSAAECVFPEVSSGVSPTQTGVCSEQKEITTVDWGKVQHPVTITVTEPRTLLKPSFNLAAYVNQSETLSELLKLGVDLSEVEKKPGAADLLVQLTFEDVKPYLYFLHDCGVADEKMGIVLTKNPFLFKESIEDLQIRVNYLKSKKFKNEIITSVIEKSPLFLLMKVEQLDMKLGFYQFLFRLKGNEVRAAVGKLPKLLTWNKDKLKETKFYVKEFLGFSEVDMKQMFLVCPKVYLTDKHQLGKKFDFLYNVMKISHSELVQWPNVFRCRLHLLKQRHQYLMSIERAQYDPTKEHFISMKSLVSKTDQEWCEKVAKTSVNQYNMFLKTL